MAPCMHSLKSKIEAKDKAGVVDTVRELQKKSARIGAGKVYYACYYILQNRDTDEMMKHYPLLVEAVIELKRFMRKQYADFEGKS